MNSALQRAALRVADAEVRTIAPGISLRTLHAGEAVRVWFIEMQPGTQWPYVDRHDEHGEHLYVVDGELIEGTDTYAAGTFVYYPAGSSHQPRTELGVRMIGFNILGDLASTPVRR